MNEGTLLAVITRDGVPIVALMLFAGELGIPTGIPIEVALLLTGSYAVHSLPGLLFALALLGLADFLGTTTLHLVARTGGVRLLTRLLRRSPSSQGGVFDRWHQRLGKHDTLAVFVLRLLPVVRMWASAGAGLVCLPLRAFLCGAAPAALLWAGLPLTLGYLLGPQVQTLASRCALISHGLLVAVPLLFLAATLYWCLRHAEILRARLRRWRALIGPRATRGIGTALALAIIAGFVVLGLEWRYPAL